MRRGVLFASPRIAMEWPNIHPPLRDRLLLLADYVNREFDKPFTLTCLTRTKEENAAIYMKRGLPVKEDSLHVSNPTRAADVRTTTWVNGRRANLFTTEQTLLILEFWRKGGKGFGGQEEPKYWHIHLQCKP